MELSIVTLHHRTPDLFKLCLKSIREHAAGLDYELIVVDSMSSRQSKDVVKEVFPEAVYLPFDQNLGYSKGVNIGLRQAQGEYILVLNPDIIITKDSIQEMLKFMKSHPDVGMSGPRLLNFNNTHQQSYFRYYRPMTVLARRGFFNRFKYFKNILDDFVMAETNPEKIQSPDWIMGSAMMVSREAINKVGLFDERFFMYFEDVDWCRRFWHNSYNVVYYSKAVFYHYHQRESKSGLGLLDAVFNQKTRWHIKSAFKFFWKYRNLGNSVRVSSKSITSAYSSKTN